MVFERTFGRCAKQLWSNRSASERTKEARESACQIAQRPGGLTYTYPDRLSDETIEIYFRPLVESPLRKAQLDQCVIGLGTNVLIPIREELADFSDPQEWSGL